MITSQAPFVHVTPAPPCDYTVARPSRSHNSPSPRGRRSYTSLATLREGDETYHPRNGHSSVSLESGVYVFGGQGEEGKLVNDLWHLSKDTKEWSEVVVDGPRPARRYFQSMTINPDDQTIWLFGGFGTGKTFMNDVWQFNPASRSWTQVLAIGTAPPPCALHTCLFSQNCLIVYGGLERGPIPCSNVWRLNTETHRWSIETPKSGDVPRFKPGSRYAHHCTLFGDWMFVAGGYSSLPGEEKRKFEDVWRFSLSCGIWQPVEPTNASLFSLGEANLHRACSVTVGDTWIFVGSGSTLPVLRLSNLSWVQYELDAELPPLCRHSVSTMRLNQPRRQFGRSDTGWPLLVVTGGQLGQKSTNATYLISDAFIPMNGIESSLSSSRGSSLDPFSRLVPSCGDSTVDTMSNCSEQLQRERQEKGEIRTGGGGDMSEVVTDLIARLEELTQEIEQVNQFNRELQAQTDKWKCSICFEEDVGAVFIPCNHMGLCEICVGRIMIGPAPRCPICRNVVERIIRPFFPS